MVQKREVIKHSAAIHIRNDMTMLQRRAWNVLLYNAYYNLPDQEEHYMEVGKLIEILEFDSKNEEYLKEALDKLVGYKIEWNILGKDSHVEWGVTTLLSQAKIQYGICTYAYSPELRRRLHNPTMYARINLSMQNVFNSGHAQALWELCVDYLHETRGYGETQFIPLQKFRELMGVDEHQYPEFKRFNIRVIKDPVAEINRVTDFQVEVDYKRERRRVVAIKFKVRQKLALPHQYANQGDLFQHPEDLPVTIKVLKDAGLSTKDALKIHEAGFDSVDAEHRPSDMGDASDAVFAEYVREKVDLLQRRQQEHKVKSVTGFLLKAISENWANPEFGELSKSAVAQIEKRSQEELEERQRCVEEAYGQKLSDLCEQIVTKDLALLERITQALLEVPFNRSQYDAKKSPTENYLKSHALRSLINEQLMVVCADQFEVIHREYENEAVDFGKQL